MKENVLVKDKYFKLFIEEQKIQERIAVISSEMSAIYENKKPIFIVILNGAFMFASDIIKNINFDCEINFIKLSSYEALNSTGTVSTLIGLSKSIEGRHIVILEDIIDTGRTIHYFTKALEKENAASVAVCSLLVKPTALQFNIDIDFIGFEIEDKFVIGFGLDYDEYGRNYKSIYRLVEQ
jgi:hypoxanthine phosphoribosyltransferase